MAEEDPLVAEIPVFLSQALAEHLYIFQYPVKPGTTNWDDSKVVNSLIKTKNKQVKLEFGIDTYSDKYCQSKGEQIAINTDGDQETARFIRDKEREKGQYFKSGTMDKMAYESLAPSVGSNYAVAIIQDKELHCTPVNGIVQMRPSYSYFDKQDKRSSDSKKAENSDDEEEESEAQQVTVKFARQESDVAKKAREKSFDYVSRRSAEEPWCDAIWRHSNSDHADLERLKLFCPNSSMGAALCLPAAAYLPSLVPPPPPEELETPVDAGSVVEPRDLRSVHKMSLLEQCKAVLKEAKLMQYNDIKSLVRGADNKPPSNSSLLTALSAGGCCVRGLWAASSAELYTVPSPEAGVPVRLMCAARDYVLYLFTQSPYVDRRKVAAAVRLPPTEVLEILKTVSKFNPTHQGWELFLPPDINFEQTYTDVVQRQNLYWEAKQRQFNEMLSGDNSIPKRQRKKSQRESFSETMQSPKPRCNSTSSLNDDDGENRKRPKNKSSTGLGKRTRNVSVSSVGEVS